MDTLSDKADAPIPISSTKISGEPARQHRGTPTPSNLERPSLGVEAVPLPESPGRLYDGSFLLAFTSQTCFVIANTLMAHYSRWIDFLGGSLSEIGWIMGAGASAGIALRPLLAQFINRVGAKKTWAIGYLVFSVASFANLWLVDLHWSIYLFRAANVLGAAIVFASSLTYISQTAPEDRRTEAIGILGVGGFIGMLIGPFLGDLILGSGVRQREDFLTLFLVAGLANLLPAVLLYFVRSPNQIERNGRLHLREFVDTVAQYFPGMILLVDFAFGMCMTVPFVFAASYIDDVGLSLGAVSPIGFFFWCYAGAGILFRLSLRRLPDRIGAERVLVVGLLTMTIGMFSFYAVSGESPWLLALPATLTGVGHSLMFHTMTSLTLAPFPMSRRGTGSALALMMLDLGMFTGAPVLGYVGDLFDYTAMFSCLACFCLFTTILYAWASFRTGATG